MVFLGYIISVSNLGGDKMTEILHRQPKDLDQSEPKGKMKRKKIYKLGEGVFGWQHHEIDFLSLSKN